MSLESERLLANDPSTREEVQCPRKDRTSPWRTSLVQNAFAETVRNKKKRKLFGLLLCLTAITYLTTLKVFESDDTGIIQPTVFTRIARMRIREITTESNDYLTLTAVPAKTSQSPSGIVFQSSTTTPTPLGPETAGVTFTTENLDTTTTLTSTTTDKSEPEKLSTTISVNSETTHKTLEEIVTTEPATATTKAEASTSSPQDESISSTDSDTGTKNDTKSYEDEDIDDVSKPKKSSSEQACKIPKLDPWDPTIRKIVKAPITPSKCGKKYPKIFGVDIGVNSSLLEINPPKKFGWKNCCYKLVSRGLPTSSAPDDSEKFSKVCYPMKKKSTEIPVDHEFLAVYCDSISNSTLKGKMLDAFAIAPLKPSVEKRILKFHNSSEIRPETQVNLVILTLDAVSHMNFKRIMPKVHKYLVQSMSAISMDGYTKIGDNTFPNILALMTNQNVSESTDFCSKSKFFDKCPFIWNDFAKSGYRTAFGEDSPWMGCFNYLKNGFRNQPTDYYLRPIARVAEKGIKDDHRMNANLCYGPRLSFEFLLNYMKSMAITMGFDKRYFQLMWATSLTHDYLNLGRLGEPLLLEFLHWITTTGYLNNTVFVLTSDHGIRWGAIRSTHQGKIEESMPFIYFVFPDWFKMKYKTAVDNLVKNRDRLTTPFDVYATFRDILKLDKISEKALTSRTEKLNEKKLPRGISLFLPVPKSRTCEMAQIAEHWCICHNAEDVSLSDKDVQQAANFAVFNLNSMIAKHPQCAYLTLESVQFAQLVYPKYTKIFGKKGDKVLELGFTTIPGHSTFDATVIKNSNSEWTVSGVISRINLYGNQSYCVDSKDMKKYCYCNSL